MHLQRLEINNIRNFQTAHLSPSKRFNIIIGENGSGKTSLLEAIFLLSVGRSFRTHFIRRVINYNSPSLSVFGVVSSASNQTITAGIEKHGSGDTKIKISGKNIDNLAELAVLLPVQLINNNSFQLLTAGPKYRRQFIDWGLFHVEPKFFPVWKHYNSALKQRNAALRKREDRLGIKAWDKILLSHAHKYDNFRREYLKVLEKFFFEFLKNLLDLESLSISYFSGWRDGADLQLLLEESIQHDFELGYTQYGPHRADVSIKVNQIPAQDILSRGQQKLLISSLCLAQGMVLKTLANKTCVYLIDDLPSELDQNSLDKIIEVLKHNDAQVFLTSIDLNYLSKIMGIEFTKLFHVEMCHGYAKVSEQ